MQNKLKIPVVLFMLFAIAVSCSDEQRDCSGNEDQIQKPINPNGDSELALLMRAMYDEAHKIKQQVANNEKITVDLDHKEILTAHATEPEKAASEEYKAFAESYLYVLKKLQTARPDEMGDLYDVVIENCMSCHRTFCPGPMVKIKKLRRPVVDN